MSKKPYIFQQGSNNLVIVPTENYERSPKKVKLDNDNVSEKVPVQIQRESVINSVSNQVHYGVSSRNNNVLIDVSKIRRQQNSWATNFLQSIGGSHKSSRIYNNVATKSTFLPKENNLPNNFPKTGSTSQHIKHEVHESIASRSNTDSSSKEPKANKETHLPEVQVYSYPNKKENSEHLNEKVNDKQTKPRNDNPCKETAHLKSAQIQKKVKVDSARISDKQTTSERKKITHPKSQKEAHVSKAQSIRSPRKANQVATKLKTNKKIIKSETKKESHRLRSDKPLSTKKNIVLNLKATKTCEKKNTDCGNVRRSYKESKPVNSEPSPQKEFTTKSPIKSVVKKMKYHHDPEKHYHKADCNQSKAEETSFKEMDADLRSKLKRKNHYHKDETIKENGILHNKFSTVPKSRRFVPDENLIISFNAESDSEEGQKTKEKTPVKSSKTKKKTIGGNKCKKIKLEINIILRHGDATDDESVQEDDKEDQNILENSDISFLDDFNVDEIVDSLNDLKNNTENINNVVNSNTENLHSDATRTDDTESKCVDDVESNDTIIVKLKSKSESLLHANNIEKHSVLHSSNHCQWDTSFKDSVKVEGNLSGTINESKIKSETIIEEEVSENIDNLDKIVKHLCVIKETISDLNTNVKSEIENVSEINADRLLSNEPNIKNIYSNNEVSLDTVQKDQENTRNAIQFINQVENIVEAVETKPTKLTKNNKTIKDAENIVLNIKSNTLVDDQENLSEKVTTDLINTEENISQKQVDIDVINVDSNKSCVTEIDTEPILILDTDYDIASNSNSDNYEIQNTDKTATNIIDESKETNSVSKLEAENKNNNGSERTDQNNLVEIKNGVTNDIKTNSSIPKNCKKTENEKLPNENMKNQPKVLNKGQSASNNENSVTKDELTSKIGNSSLIHDTLAHRIEARMESFLGEKPTLTSLIHRGKFSTLYRYEDKNGRKNTVKVLHTRHGVAIGLDKENMLKKLQKGVPDHNFNCVRLIDGFSMSGQWCFLMEYYPKTLREVIDNQKVQKRSFHIDDVQRLSAQLVSAVTLLRNNNIIHSDIKPSHILINDDETKLKLCGFDRSLYCHQDNVELLPKDGTVNYRAPELIMGYPADYGVDVWSTALVMYEMATTRMLFPGSFNNDILYKQLCTLDDMPLEMHQNSRFRHYHFAGAAFSRVVANGASRKLIHYVYKMDRIHSVLFKGYSIHWGEKRNLSERCKDKAKLVAFSKLLKQMLVMYPKQRIAIEFVFANPFMYGTFE